MHIASAVGTPVIALFGPTAPQRHMAPSDNSLPISKAAGMGCGPCYKPDCRKKVTCMKKISVDEVFEAMRKYIEKGEEVKV
jgi:ADP-heptose:LPS heptosyltransferase